ncbi:hypothetical protein evm_000018 [Chilo suppressalis]|nr:hypothetical protein evm_000018 [Chilo suppressalis]
MASSVLLFAAFFATVVCEETARLRYFYKSIDDYAELPLETAHDIFKLSWYNSSRPTVIFSHGFTGHPQGPAVMAIINSYLERADSNVVLLNWQEMAASNYPNMATSYVNWAAPNARKVTD